MRVPAIGARMMNHSYKKWAKSWLTKQFRSNPQLKERFVLKNYSSGDIITLPHKEYILAISKEDRKTNLAKLSHREEIHIKLCENQDSHAEAKIVRQLKGRIIANDNLAQVSKRVHELNDQYFGEKVKTVRLKNNHSNWGSCSATGNINISVKTLFAPQAVQDYVIIHELSHLKELNHSDRFWAVVKNAMPEYKKHEKWLKTNGHLCNF